MEVNLLLAPVAAKADRASALPSQRHDWVTWAWLWATCSLVMASYWTTLGKGIAGGDSGELVADACELHAVESPRYPLLILLHHLFIQYLPLAESPAWKANLVSALCTTLAAGCLFLCVVLFGRARHRCYHPTSSSTEDSSARVTSTTTLVAASATAGLFAWSPMVWRFAVTAEVFPLQSALLALLLYTTLCFACSWTSRDRRLWACSSALLCGVALTSQYRVILFEVPLMLYLAWCLRRDLARRPSAILLELGGWFVCGLLPYLYLPLASWWHTQAGSLADVTQWQFFWDHLRQGDYHSNYSPFPSSLANQEPIRHKLGMYAWDLAFRQGLGGLVPLLALLGFVAATVFTAPFLLPPRYQGERAKITRATDRHIQQIVADLPAAQPSCVHTRRNADPGPYQKAEIKARHESRQVTWALGGAWVLSLVLFVQASSTLLRGELQRLYMQANLLGFMFGGVGLDWLACVVARGKPRAGGQPRDGLPSSNPLSKLGRVVCVVLALWQFQMHFAVSDKHANTYFEQYARSLLAPLPQDALLLVDHDVQWTSLRYLQACEGHRSDVTVLNLSLLSSPWGTSKRGLSSGKVVFPGTRYYVSEHHFLARTDQAFTARTLVDANIDRVGGIFVAGNLTFPRAEVQLRSAYTGLPMGLSVQLFRHQDVLTMKQWLGRHSEVWRLLQQHPKELLSLAELPALDKYPTGTWEYTIRRDYMAHSAEAAAHLLEEAIALQEQYDRAAVREDDNNALIATKMSSTLVLKHFLEAAWWLEVLVANDLQHTTHTLKNLGLAYFHLLYLSPTIPVAAAEAQLRRVPRASPFSDEVLATTTPQWFSGRDRHETGWRMWLLNRFDEAWGACLRRPDAQNLPEASKMRQQHQQIMARMRPLLEKEEDITSGGFRRSSDTLGGWR